MRRLASFSRVVLPALLIMLAVEARAIEIVAIEEYWELQVGQPDGPSSSPQVCMVMSPDGTLDNDYFMFTLNHHSHPQYVAGGMQVQRWLGEEIQYARIGPKEGTLHQVDETVTWVQRLSLADGSLTFEISNGASDSWGTFGDAGILRFSVASNAVNLNSYRPAISLEQSGVSFAGNRVRSLTLTRLRWTDSEGQVYELVAPIDVDADLDP